MAEHVTTIAVVMLTVAATSWVSVALALLVQTIRRLIREWAPASLGDELDVFVRHTRTVTLSPSEERPLSGVAHEHAL